MRQRPPSTAFWRFVHNVIAHPLMEILPESAGDWLHDETARRAWIAQDAASDIDGARALKGNP